MTPEARHKYQEIPVQFTADGTPMAVRYENRIWMVDPDVHAAHWFTRDSWWETQRRAAVGSGDLVSIEHWQVQATLPTSDQELHTFTIRREPLATGWLLESVS
ncbi:hypothetical protein NicSoilE8_38120 [Arthrobacter sp. NicSoilE8]|nr:hypothetical protein NicSoilE8_38120 [Arthrobacter sp. NicSoilE8]